MSKVTFTVEGSTGHRRIKAISVTYVPGKEKTVTKVELEKDSVPNQKIYDAGEKFDPTGLSIYAYWDGTIDDQTNIADKFNWNNGQPLIAGQTSVSGKYEKDKRTTDDAIITINGLTVISTNEYIQHKGIVTPGQYIVFSDGVAMNDEIITNGPRLSYNSIISAGSSANTGKLKLIWDIQKEEDGSYTFKNVNANKYLASTTSKNQATLVDEITEKAKWTITPNGDNHVITNNAPATAENNTLRRNGTNGFGAYLPTTGSAPALYKLKDTRTFKSLTVGDGSAMTKKAYISDEQWDPSGLKVMLNCEGEEPVDITEYVNWSFSPALPNDESITSVIPTASYCFNGVMKYVEFDAQTVTVEKARTVEPTGVTIEGASEDAIVVDGDKYFEGTYQLNATVSYTQGDDYKDGDSGLIWTTSDKNTISVNQDGQIKFLKVSENPVTITATSKENSELKASIIYDVKSFKGFTAEHPLTATEAANPTLYSQYGTEMIYVSGYVSELDGSYRWISSTKGGASEFEIFSKTIEFKNNTNEDDYVVGTKILAYGKLGKYTPKDSDVTTYELKNPSETANVEMINLEGIEDITSVVASGAKATYNYGDTFDPTGLILTAKRASSITEYPYNADKMTIEPNRALTDADTKVTISWHDETVEFPITVNKTLKSITIKDSPKVSYIEGQAFDPTGLSIECLFEGDAQHKETVAYSSEAGFTFDVTNLELETENVEVTYGGKSVNLPVSVAQKQISTVELKDNPSKVSYVEGQTFSAAGLKVTAKYDNGENVDVAYTGNEDDFVIPTTALSTSMENITVQYKGHNVAVPLTVVARAVVSAEIENNVTKTSYIEGQTFDPSGLKVKLTYNDDSCEYLEYVGHESDFTFSKNALNTTDDQISIFILGQKVDVDITVIARAIVSAVVETPVSKVDYVEGQQFNPAGLKVKFTYNDNSFDYLEYAGHESDFTFSKNALSTTDDQISIFILGQEIKVNINVVAKALTESKIKTNPSDLEYFVGEGLDPRGLVISLDYNDGEHKEIAYSETNKTDFAFSVSTVAAGNTAVTVSYKGINCGSFNIHGTEVVLDHLEITHSVNKNEYFTDETFSYEGLVIQGVKNNGERFAIDLDDCEISSPDMSTAGNKTVYVTYNGVRTSFNILVKAILVDSLELNTENVRKEYQYGDQFSYEGLEVTAHYNNGSSRALGIEEIIVHEPEMHSGKNEVSITFSENGVTRSASFVINVNGGQEWLEDIAASDNIVEQAIILIAHFAPEVSEVIQSLSFDPVGIVDNALDLATQGVIDVLDTSVSIVKTSLNAVDKVLSLLPF